MQQNTHVHIGTRYTVHVHVFGAYVHVHVLPIVLTAAVKCLVMCDSGISEDIGTTATVERLETKCLLSILESGGREGEEDKGREGGREGRRERETEFYTHFQLVQ